LVKSQPLSGKPVIADADMIGVLYFPQSTMDIVCGFCGGVGALQTDTAHAVYPKKSFLLR
jgi:hypothetical protein